jgi:hypothetical protein
VSLDLNWRKTLSALGSAEAIVSDEHKPWQVAIDKRGAWLTWAKGEAWMPLATLQDVRCDLEALVLDEFADPLRLTGYRKQSQCLGVRLGQETVQVRVNDCWVSVPTQIVVEAARLLRIQQRDRLRLGGGRWLNKS